MFSCVYKRTDEVIAVHAGWLQSQFSLTILRSMAVMTTSSSALPGLSFLWPCKTRYLFFLATIGMCFFCSRSYVSFSAQVFLLQNDECSLLLFGFLESPVCDR